MMILEQLAPNSNDEIVLVQLIMIWYQILSWERKWLEVLKIRSVLFVVVEDVFAFPDVAVVVISTNENKNYCNILAELVSEKWILKGKLNTTAFFQFLSIFCRIWRLFFSKFCSMVHFEIVYVMKYSKNVCNQLCTFNSWRDLWYACQKLTELVVVEVDDEDMLLLWSLSMDW